MRESGEQTLGEERERAQETGDASGFENLPRHSFVLSLDFGKQSSHEGSLSKVLDVSSVARHAAPLKHLDTQSRGRTRERDKKRKSKNPPRVYTHGSVSTYTDSDGLSVHICVPVSRHADATDRIRLNRERTCSPVGDMEKNSKSQKK